MNRHIIAVATIVAVLAGMWLAGWVFSPRPGVTKENYGRLKKGMTRSEVEAILGKPTMKSAHGDITSAWGDEDKDICDVAVWYDNNGRVGLTAWLRPQELIPAGVQRHLNHRIAPPNGPEPGA